MATEYRLPYTAQEINEKLGKVSVLEEDITSLGENITNLEENIVNLEENIVNKQDKLTFDNEPVEGSDNPITSGGVYETLQNFDAGETYTAGDLIEIKDGVISSTLGKCISGGLIESTERIVRLDNIEMSDEGGIYAFNCDLSDYSLSTYPDQNSGLIIEMEQPDGTKKTFDIDVLIYEGDDEHGQYYTGLYNLELTDDGELVILDENLDALYFTFYTLKVYNGIEIQISIATWQDYTGASLTISKKMVEDTREYALLPDTALGLGRKIVTENNVELINVPSFPAGQEIEEGVGIYDTVIEQDYIAPTISDIVQVELSMPNTDGTITFNDIECLEYDGMSLIAVNTEQTDFDAIWDSNVIPKIDEGVPSLYIIFVAEDGLIDIISSEDLTGASIVVTKNEIVTTHVKLPNEALSFDEEPTEGSKNLVNSGCIYNILGNIGENFGSELDNKQDRLTFDSTPIANSTNPITSGGVYETLQNIDVDNQLVEGFTASGTELTKGLSANRLTIPTGVKAWIEGAASPPINISDMSNVSRVYLNTHSITLNKNTTTVSEIYIECNEGVTDLYNVLYNNVNLMSGQMYMSVIFEDMPNTSYFISSRNTGIKTNDTQVYFDFLFVTDDTFSVTTEGTRNISSLLLYPINGYASHAEGLDTYATEEGSHAEGVGAAASGYASHAEGYHTTASGYDSHAEGHQTTASGTYSHSEGYQTTASEMASHAEGYNTIASNWYSHAEGINTKAYGTGSHVEGQSTIASGNYQHVQGRYNIKDTSDNKYAHIVGNGISEDTRSNAHTLDWDGNAWFAGDVESTAIILKSSTPGSSKRFKVTVNDSGTLSATEVVQ